MIKYITIVLTIFLAPVSAFSDASVSPFLYFLQYSDSFSTAKIAVSPGISAAKVTIRFKNPPSDERIEELEEKGVVFTRDDGLLLHSHHIYHGTVLLDSLDSLRKEDDIIRIESTFRPSASPTLNVSNPQVQASQIWSIPHESEALDGSGVIIADVDTGIDIFHPGFFKPDGGEYNWIDVNKSGSYENAIDAVDLNNNGIADSGESLNFFDAGFSDPLNLMDRNLGIYDADIDWLYNDANGNGVRDYGPSAGYTEIDPSFGEILFIISDDNKNNRLDPQEKLIALGSSRIIASFDKQGKHYRGKNLFDSLGDVINHGTGACGIVGGQSPGRRLTGMAPGVEFISIDRIDTNIEEGILWAKNQGAHIIMYEFGSWVYEFLDGTSNLEVLINDLYDEGIHQFTASGNLAGPARKKHAYLTLEKGQQKSLSFTVPDDGATYVYASILWVSDVFSPTITLQLPDSQTFTLNGDGREKRIGGYSIISGIDTSPINTKKMDLVIKSSMKISGDFSFILKNNNPPTLSIDAYITDNVSQWMHGTQFQNYLTDDGTICAPGTSVKGITVGAYDPRGTRNTQGDINDFSSWGDTIDGRRAVDITAPGTLVYSLTSHDAVGGQPGGYMDFGGTSSALPHVVGCAALVLQLSPGIEPDELSRVLLEGALVDEFTGDVPNNVWGYGKLRVYDALRKSYTPLHVEETIQPTGFSVSAAYPNPFNAKTTFTISVDRALDSPITLDIYNILGQKVRMLETYAILPGEYTLTWDGTDDSSISVSSGIYLCRFSSDNFISNKSVLLLK